MADWGPMVGAKFAVKADVDVTADDQARFNLILVGSAPLNSLVPAAEMPDPRLLGRQGLPPLVADPPVPGPLHMVLGALTPRAFAR